MLISLLWTNPILFLIISVVLVFSLSIHEFAHAWIADKLGDPTPRINNRVSLDPRAHLDPVGTLAILFIGFGWGKPVVFDPYNLKNPLRDAALIALAGPLSNLILAVTFALLYHLGVLNIFGQTVALFITSQVVYLNVMLAIFNLVPIYPLDGEKILRALLPSDMAYEYSRVVRQYGMMILLFLIIPIGGVSAISRLIGPIINQLSQLLLG